MTLPILTYHRLLPEAPTVERDPKRIAVSQEQFRTHLRWLKRFGYRSVRLEDYVQRLKKRQSYPPRHFAITFDDGYVEVLTLALPVLKEFGFTATVFAVSDELGGKNHWDDGEAALLTIDQYRELEKAGITIGAHSCTHAHLPRVEDALAKRELRDSKIRLEAALGHPVALFAYPYGETDDRIDAFAREAGFEAAFATDRAPQHHADNPYRLRRAVVFPKNNAWEILIKVQPWYFRYQDWKKGRKGEWANGR